MPALSIVIPVYNAEKFIDRCMGAVLSQTFNDYEVILVNDGSTDRSLELCRKYEKKYNNIFVIDKENEGSGPTRTKGMYQAKGEYLAFPDVDDWFEPDMYQDLYSVAKQNNADIVVSGVNHYYKNEENKIFLHHSSICPSFLFKTKKECRLGVMKVFPTSIIFDSPANKLYRRLLIMDNNITFKYLRRCQDAVFNLDVYNVAERVVAVPKAYYNYIENNVSDVMRKFPKDYKDIVIYYNRHLKELLVSWEMFFGDIRLHYDSSFVLGIFSALRLCNNKNWNFTKKQKKEYLKSILENSYVCERICDIQIRSDCQKEFKLIAQQDVKGILHFLQIENLKENLRKNNFFRFLYKMYKFIR